MDDDERVRIDLRLVGTSSLEGEISLAALGGIARHAHDLVVRLTREMTGRSGPGRTPAQLGHEVELSLKGIRAGSTVLELVGPAQGSFDLGADHDLPAKVFEELIGGLAALSDGTDLPGVYTPLVRESLRGLVEAAGDGTRLDIETSGPGSSKLLSIDLPSAKDRLAGRDSSPPEPEVIPNTTSTGTLVYADLDSHRFALRDDSGRRVPLREGSVPVPVIIGLLGQRVIAVGEARVGASGIPAEVRLSRLDGVTAAGSFDETAFRRSASLDELLDSVGPIDLDDLDMHLSDAEAAAFLAAIAER